MLGDVLVWPFVHWWKLWPAGSAWKRRVQNTASPASRPLAVTSCSKVYHQFLADPDSALFWRKGEGIPKLVESFHSGFLYSAFFFPKNFWTDTSAWSVQSVPSVKVIQHCTAAPWITVSHPVQAGATICLLRQAFLAVLVTDLNHAARLLFKGLTRREDIFCFLCYTASALSWGIWDIIL